MKRYAAILLAALMLPLLSGVTAEATPVGVRLPLSYRSWNLEESGLETTTTQWVVPLHLSVPMGRAIDLIARSAAHSGTLDGEATSDFSGITDTQVGLVGRLAGGRLIVQGMASFPTGTTSLDEEQLTVALALAPPFLGYRVRQAGRGRDLGVGISYAFPLASGWAVGLGTGYLHRGSFVAIENGPEVRPGAETRLSAGIDGRVGRLVVRFDGTRRIYGRDEGEGIAYEEPPVWEGSLGLAAQAEGWRFDGRFLLSSKKEGETGLSPYSGTYTAGGITLRRALGRSTWFGVTGEAVRFVGFEDEEGEVFDSITAGIGPLLILPLARAVRLEGRLLYLSGDLDGAAINGYDAQLVLAVTGPSPEL